MCSTAICNYGYSQLYIRNAKDDFAVMPVDYDKLGLFAGSLYDKMVEAFRYTGRDCPEFQKYMNTLRQNYKIKISKSIEYEI